MKLLAIAALMGSVSMGLAQTFDWETLPATGSFSSVSQTVGGLTATATGEGGNVLVYDASSLSGFGSFGSRSLDGGQLLNYLPLRVTFSSTVSSVTAWFGDAGVDDDGVVTIAAYSVSGQLLTQSSFNYGTTAVPESLTVTAPGISYVIGSASGTPTYPNSVLYDNFTVTSVPEPTSMCCVALGVLALIRRKAQ
jgi:hypothetical protein